MNPRFASLRDKKKFLSHFANADEVLKKSNDDELEKSDIYSAINEYGTKICVKKSGAEIKKQVQEILIPELNAELAQAKAQVEADLKLCGNAPTKEVPAWWTRDLKMEIPFRFYDWEETYIPERCVNCDSVYQSLSVSDAQEKFGNRPEDGAQAEMRRKYNDDLRKVCEVMVDLAACEVLKQIKDNDSYDLTASQVISLKFDK